MAFALAPYLPPPAPFPPLLPAPPPPPPPAYIAPTPAPTGSVGYTLLGDNYDCPGCVHPPPSAPAAPLPLAPLPPSPPLTRPPRPTPAPSSTPPSGDVGGFSPSNPPSVLSCATQCYTTYEALSFVYAYQAPWAPGTCFCKVTTVLATTQTVGLQCYQIVPGGTVPATSSPPSPSPSTVRLRAGGGSCEWCLVLALAPPVTVSWS